MSIFKIFFSIVIAVMIVSALAGLIAFMMEILTKPISQFHGLYERFIKRSLDVFVATAAFIFLFPVLFMVAILVRVKLGSPVLFKQDRPGRNEKIFKLIKFRTMTDERDECGKLLPDTLRLTKFGRILRSTSLDELPELINIIKGDMSLIGPRPLAVAYLPYYTNKEKHRHDVRPGLTGLAQVSGRNSISWDSKLQFDLNYIENLSFTKDVKILFLTVKKVFLREGIGQGEEQPKNLYDERKDWLDTEGKIKLEYQD